MRPSHLGQTRWVYRLLPLAGVLTLFVAACQPAATPTPSTPTSTPAPKPTTPPTAAAQPSPAVAKPASPQPAASPSAAAATIALPKPEKASIKIGFSALEAIMTTYAMAQDVGLFKKYGFENVELLWIETDSRALQALISGSVDGTAQSPAVSISSQITDTPVVTVAMNSTRITDDLFAVPSVKTAADLKGKRIAISSFGGTSHASVLLALKGLGLTEQDVTIVQVGGEAARVAALKSGSVEAAPMEIFRRNDMKQQGFNQIFSVADDPSLRFVRNGLNFRREFFDQNPNTILTLTASLLEAQQLLSSQTDRAIDAYAKLAQINDRNEAAARVNSLLPYMQRDLRWTREAFEFARDVMATQNAALKDVDVTKAYTFKFLDQLQGMGFNDAVGVPKA